MRIAIVCPEFPPHTVGGGGTVVEHVAHSLAKDNLVDVVFGSWNNDDVKSRGNPTVTPASLIRFPGTPASLLTSMPPTPRGLLSIFSELRRKPSIAHLHGIGHPIVDIAAMICNALGISYIYVCHGLPLASNPHPGPTRLLYRSYQWLIGLRTLKEARYVIAISKRVANSLELMGIEPAKIRICYHTPKTETIHRESVSFRDLAHIPPSKKIVLFIGSISYRKGADLAIEIASSLLRLRSDFLLCMIGQDGGMMREILRKTQELQITDHVKILGRVAPSVRDSALEACDVVLFPSRDEPYGLVPLEAIGQGKPVLVSTHSGVAELLKSSELLFDPLQTELAARKVNEILENPRLAKKLVNEASESIQSIPREESESVYEELSLKSSVTLS